MSFDPNLYAIQLQLSLNSDSVFESLDEIESKALKIEESLNRAIQNSLDNLSLFAKELDNTFSGAIQSLDRLGTVQGQNLDSLDKAVVSSAESTKELEKQIDMGQEYNDLLKERNDLNEELKKFEDNIKAATEDRIENQHQINDIAQSANRNYRDTDNLVAGVNDSLSDSAVITDNWISKLDGAIDQLKKIKSNVMEVVNELITATKATEDFVTVNYRLYGGQHALTAEVAITAGQYGLLQERVLAATKAMMGINIPKQELEKYVVTMVMVNRITGVAIETLGEYTRIMRGSGASYQEVEANLTILIAAQREFGFTLEETNRLLSIQNEHLSRSTFLLGSETPKQLQESIAVMAALAKQTGVSSSVVDDFAEKLSLTGSAAIEFYSKIGGDYLAGTADRREAILNFYDDMANKLVAIGDTESEQFRNSLTGYQLQLEGMGLNADMLQVITQMKLKEGNANKSANELYEEYLENLKNGLDINGQMLEGMDGFYAQWQKLTSAINSVIEPFQHFIATCLIPYIKLIGDVISVIATVIAAVKDWWTSLEEMYPVFGYIRQGVQLLIGALIIMGVVGAAGITVLVSIGAALLSLVGIFTTATFATGAFGTAFITMLGSIGTAIQTFVVAVSSALSRMATALTPSIPALLAVGAALALAGASALMFAYASTMVADRGMEAVAVMVAMAATITLLGVALVTLGTAAANPATIIGLGALTIAILGVSLAMSAVILSASLFVAVFTEMLKSIDDEIDDRVINLTMALLGLAAASPAITIAFLPLGGALMAVVIPATLAGVALMFLAGSLAVISSIEIPDIGDDLANFAASISSSAIAFIQAGLTVSIISAVGKSFKNSMIEFKDGVAILKANATAFDDATAVIKRNVIDLSTISNDLYSSAHKLIFGSQELKTAGEVLVASSASLTTGANSLITASQALAKAAPALETGANAISSAADTMKDSTKRLSSSADTMNFTISSLSSSVHMLSFITATFNELSFDGSTLASSISNAAVAISSVVDELDAPIDALADKVDSLVALIDKLADQETRISDIGSKINDSLPAKEVGNIPNEIKSTQALTEVVNNITEVKNDSKEVVDLLTQILEVMKNNSSEKKSMPFGKLAGSKESAEKLREIGYDS